MHIHTRGNSGDSHCLWRLVGVTLRYKHTHTNKVMLGTLYALLYSSGSQFISACVFRYQGIWPSLSQVLVLYFKSQLLLLFFWNRSRYSTVFHNLDTISLHTTHTKSVAVELSDVKQKIFTQKNDSKPELPLSKLLF